MLRGIFFGLLVVSFVAFTGCGGKKGAGTATDGTDQSPNAAQGGNGGGGNGGADSGGATDPLAYVSSDFVGAIVMNPPAIFESAIGKAVVEHEKVQEDLDEMPFDPRSVQRMLVLMDAPESGKPTASPGTVMHMTRPLDAEQSATVIKDAVGDEAEKATHAGETYHRSPFNCIAVVNGGKTVLVGPEAVVKKMLDAKTPGESKLIAKLKSLDSKQGVSSVFLLDSMKDTLDMAAEQAKNPQSPPMLTPFAEVADKLTEMHLGFDLTQENLLDVQLACADEESANKLNQAANGALQFGKFAYPQLQAQLAADEGNADLVKVLDAIVESVAIVQEGNTVRLTAKRPEGLDANATALVDKAIQAMQGPPDEWKEYKFDEQQFAVQFPQEPNVNEIPTQPGNDFGPLKQWYIGSFSNDTDKSFTVEIRKLRETDLEDGPEKFLEQELEFSDAKSQKKVMVDGFPGVNYTTEFDFGDKKIYQRHLIVLANDMLYNLECDIDDEQGNVPEFFDSFKLLKGE